MANTNTNQTRIEADHYLVLNAKTGELEGTFLNMGMWLSAVNYAMTLAEVEYNQGNDDAQYNVTDENEVVILTVAACHKI